MNLNHFNKILQQSAQFAGTVDEVTKQQHKPLEASRQENGQKDEYARLNELLTALAKETYESMEEIQGINLKMRMISFNSKIEAARAGEAGRAFSIVSNEMKILSDQTAAVASALRTDSNRATAELKSLCEEMSSRVRGTRLADLALNNIDLIDRNLYERSCDVRWWATDSSLVDALEQQTDEAYRFASQRLGMILNAYTVYYDLVLCDINGKVVANGRPQKYQSNDKKLMKEHWVQQAMKTSSGDHYGFQSVHCSPLVKGERVLIYSAAVREGGATHGKIIGTLGIVFNYDALAQTIMFNTPIGEGLHNVTRVCITDDAGLVLADSKGRLLQETMNFPGMEQLYTEAKGYVIVEIDSRRYCIAHAIAPGYETYTTGWHSLILQQM